jgi:hypothetical protein
VTRERLRNLAAKLGKVSKRAVSATVTEEVARARREAGDADRARQSTAQPEPHSDRSDNNMASKPEDELPQSAPNWKQAWALAMAELNARYFVASMGGSVRVARLVRDEALGRDRLVFLREADIRLKYAHCHYKVGVSPSGRDIVLGAGEAWLSDYRRRTYDRIALIPDGPCPPEVYNLWRGFGVQPKAGSWATIEVHLRTVVCSGNAEHYRWLVGWLAYASSIRAGKPRWP